MVQEAQARPGDPQKCPLQHSAALQDTQTPRNPAQGHWQRCFQFSNTRKIIFFWKGREAPHPPQLLLLVLDFIAFCQGREMGSGGEARMRYLQWCPTWSSSQGFFFHSPGTPGHCPPLQTGSFPVEKQKQGCGYFLRTAQEPKPGSKVLH